MPVKRQHADGSTAPKRTRFAASTSEGAPTSASGSRRAAGSSRASTKGADDEEEDLLAADLPEGAQQAKRKDRRQLTGKEGYDSDSSNDDEGVVFSRRKDKGSKAGGEDEDDDLDMFGAGSDDEDGKGKGKAKDKGKDKEFLDLKDIEGQEFEEGRQQGGIYSDDEDDVSTGKSRRAADDDGMDIDVEGQGPEDEDEETAEARRAAKRIAQLDGDMGYEMTGFNMKNEMEEGRFTADGETYVANAKDEGEKHDMWLTEVDDEAILKARRAHREREKREAELEKEEQDGAASEEARKKEEALMREAVELMQRGETILEALQRLGVEVEKKRKEESKKKSWAERQKERKAQQEGGSESNPFTQLTNIVSTLSNMSQLDVYSLSRESIQRMLPAIGNGASGNGAPASGQHTPPVRDTRSFQYRFSMGYVRSLPEAQRPVEREVFGPFPVQQLSQWRNTGFFGGPACENVELRLAGAEPGPWGSWETIVGK